MDINVKGTENLLETCHENNVCNLIFASSATVYGDLNRLPITEDCTLNMLSPHDESKMLGEQCISSYTRIKNKNEKFSNS